jgi:hypothetical protein
LRAEIVAIIDVVAVAVALVAGAAVLVGGDIQRRIRAEVITIAYAVLVVIKRVARAPDHADD